MPSPEEIAAAKKVLGLKANPTSRSEDIMAAKKDFIAKKTQAAKAALNSSNPEDQIEAASEAGEEGAHVDGCMCKACIDHPEGCMCKECETEEMPGHGHFTQPHSESTQITNFIKALSQKNYASANKYLQGVVEGKLKRSISKAYNK